MYSRLDVDWVYTPFLNNSLPSLLPDVKTVNKDKVFLQVRVLELMGPVAMLLLSMYIYGFLA